MDIDESETGNAPRFQGDGELNQQQPQAEAATRRAVVVDNKMKTGAAAPVAPRRSSLPAASAPAAHVLQPTRKQVAESSSPVKGAPRQPADQTPGGEGRSAGAFQAHLGTRRAVSTCLTAAGTDARTGR